MNLLTYIRTLRMGQGAKDAFVRFFLKGGTLDLPWFTSAFKEGEDYAARKLSASNYKGLAAFSSLSLSTLEKKADDIYIAEVKKAAFSTYGAEVVAAFLVKREYEAKNIRIILAAKKAGLDTKLIQERLRVL